MLWKHTSLWTTLGAHDFSFTTCNVEIKMYQVIEQTFNANNYWVMPRERHADNLHKIYLHTNNNWNNIPAHHKSKQEHDDTFISIIMLLDDTFMIMFLQTL